MSKVSLQERVGIMERSVAPPLSLVLLFAVFFLSSATRLGIIIIRQLSCLPFIPHTHSHTPTYITRRGEKANEKREKG